MSEHQFVRSFQETLKTQVIKAANVVRIDGYVECHDDVVLQVTKSFIVGYGSNGQMYVRCQSYRYVGLLPSHHLLLKYHNLHEDPSDYIHRVYDPRTGDELFNETLRRDQFPTFPEVLDELAFLAGELSPE